MIYLHSIIIPEEIKVRFDKIFADNSTKMARVTTLVLPFLALYQPLGKTLSLASGSVKAVSHLSSFELVKGTAAIFIVASSVFQFKLGLLISTGYDTGEAFISVGHALYVGEYAHAGEESLQALASSLYLALMVYGSLEIMLTLLLIQAALAIYQARKEWMQERYPEAIAATAMAFIRLYQARECYSQIQVMRTLLTLQKCQDLYHRALKGREVRHLAESELLDFETQVAKKTVKLSDHTGQEFDFGAHFHGLGKELEGANLEIRKVGASFELDFKVNALFREKIGHYVEDLQSMKKEETQMLLKTAHSQASNINVKVGQSLKVNVKGLGKVLLSKNDHYPTLTNRIVVKLDPGKNLFDLHELLALTGLDSVIRPVSSQDIERIKIDRLYQTFFPKEASRYKENPEFFNLPVDALKAKIVEQTPKMQAHFNDYLSNMQKVETLPGHVLYNINGLSEKAEKMGVLSLTASITGSSQDRVISMLKMGMLSNEERFFHGQKTSGMSPDADFKTGGSNFIFMQMIPNRPNFKYHELYYNASYRFLIDPKALELGTTQYNYDSFGTTDPSDPVYQNRPGILDFIRTQTKHLNGGHEVMVEKRLPPSYITHIVVPTQAEKTSLMDRLISEKLTQSQNGQEMIHGKRLDEFIRVG